MRELRASGRVVTRDSDLIAIDPGDKYVGVAFFAMNADGEWYCQDAAQLEPAEFEDGFAELILAEEAPPIVVYERWRLYADHAKEKSGNEFLASQQIGVIKYICRVRNDHVARHAKAEADGKMMSCELQGGQCADPARRVQPVEIYKQGAEIKKPTAGILRHKGIKSVGKARKKENPGWGDHCVDAELHGWKHILDTMGGEHAIQ